MADAEKSWGATVGEAAAGGLLIGAFVGVCTSSIAAVPGVVALSVVVGVVARIVRAKIGPRPYREPRPPGPRTVLAGRIAAALGLLAAVGAGILLMIWGIQTASGSPACDPEVSRCVLVVDGVNRGPTDTSVAAQQTGNVLAGAIAFIPGLAMLVGAYIGTGALIRSIRTGR